MPASNGSPRAPAVSQATFGWVTTVRPTASMAGSTSRPMARPLGATRSATRRVTAPVPQATSKARSPLRGGWRSRRSRGSHQSEALNGMALVDFGGGPAQIAQHSLFVTVHVHLGTVWNRDRVPILVSQNQTTVVGPVSSIGLWS